MANLAEVHFLPVWKKLEGEKQVHFGMSALAKMINFVVALGLSLMEEDSLLGVRTSVEPLATGLLIILATLVYSLSADVTAWARL